MEGSYDKVWVETKSERVPGEEFALFTEVRHCHYHAAHAVFVS
jgi:hypothetical protein